MAVEQYDCLVIGSGQAGTPLVHGAGADWPQAPRSSSASTSPAPASTKAARRPRRWSPAPAWPTWHGAPPIMACAPAPSPSIWRRCASASAISSRAFAAAASAASRARDNLDLLRGEAQLHRAEDARMSSSTDGQELASDRASGSSSTLARGPSELPAPWHRGPASAQLDLDHGAGYRARAPARDRRRLRRPGVRPDVPPLRQPRSRSFSAGRSCSVARTTTWPTPSRRSCARTASTCCWRRHQCARAGRPMMAVELVVRGPEGERTIIGSHLLPPPVARPTPTR